MKKIWLLISLLMCCFIFVWCGNNQQQESNDIILFNELIWYREAIANKVFSFTSFLANGRHVVTGTTSFFYPPSLDLYPHVVLPRGLLGGMHVARPRREAGANDSRADLCSAGDIYHERITLGPGPGEQRGVWVRPAKDTENTDRLWHLRKARRFFF